MPAPSISRDETIAQIIEEMRASLAANGRLDMKEWRSRYLGLADEAFQLFDTDRALVTAASNWKAAGLHETISSAPEATITHNPGKPAESVPERIGRYRILRPLGQGGMGTVYEAEDPDLRRHIALKVPHFAGSAGQQTEARQRFLRESRAAAAIQHANVCPIHDVGEDEGRPFVVMAYIEGQSLADRLDQGRIDDREAVAIIERIADALAAVHSKGIIHRDLKPGNILLRAKDGQPVLTDFGLARVENDREHATVDGTLLGTAAYMAPEQAGFDLGPITPKSDTYSLGVVLYEMLTGRRPFEGNMLQVIHKVATQTAPRASQFRKDLDPALEEILARALARQQEDRFLDATAFRKALNGWLSQHIEAPTQAKTVTLSPTEKLQPRLRRRLPGWVAVAVAVLFAAIAIAGVVVYLKPGGDKDGAIEVKLPDANVTVFVDDKEQPALDGNPKVSLKLKPGKHRFSLKRNGSEVYGIDFTVKQGEVTEWSAEYEPRPTPPVKSLPPEKPNQDEGPKPLPAYGPSPLDALSREKNVPASERLASLPKEVVAVFGTQAWRREWAGTQQFLAFTGDDKGVMAIDRFGTLPMGHGVPAEGVRVWDVATGKRLQTFALRQTIGMAYLPELHAVGLFTGKPEDLTCKIVDLHTGSKIVTLGGAYLSRMGTSPDGKLIATIDRGNGATVWDVRSGDKVAGIGIPQETPGGPTWDPYMNEPTFSPDGKQLILWHGINSQVLKDNQALFHGYDVKTGKQLWSAKLPEVVAHGRPYVTPDESRVFVATLDPSARTRALTVRSWNVAANGWDQFHMHVDLTGVDLDFMTNASRSQLFALTPDGRFVVAVKYVYDAKTGQKLHDLEGPEITRALAFSSDGKRIAGMSYMGEVAVYEITTGKLVSPRPEPLFSPYGITVSPDGTRMLVRTTPSIVRCIETVSGKELYQVRTVEPSAFAKPVFSGDGKWFLTLRAGSGQLREARTGEEVKELKHDGASAAAFSRNGKWLVTANPGVKDAVVKVWNATTQEEHRSILLTQLTQEPNAGYGRSLAIADDGSFVAVSGNTQTLVIDIETGKPRTVFNNAVGPLQLSADERILLAYKTILDMKTGKTVVELKSVGHPGGVIPALAPDGKSVFMAGDKSELIQCSTNDGKIMKVWEMPCNVAGLDITADGRYLFTNNANGTVYILRLGQ